MNTSEDKGGILASLLVYFPNVDSRRMRESRRSHGRNGYVGLGFRGS